MAIGTPEPACRCLIYHGHVQGVGFRATTERIARRFPVEGYVRNRPDGTVEVVVQGTSDAVSAFLAAVESHFTGYIDRIETGPAPQVAAMKGFTIRY